MVTYSGFQKRGICLCDPPFYLDNGKKHARIDLALWDAWYQGYDRVLLGAQHLSGFADVGDVISVGNRKWRISGYGADAYELDRVRSDGEFDEPPVAALNESMVFPLGAKRGDICRVHGWTFMYTGHEWVKIRSGSKVYDQKHDRWTTT